MAPPMADLREIEARITAPGGLFEVVTEDVRGAAMSVFKNRTRSLRALLENSRAHGDKEYVVYAQERISYAQHFARASAFAHVLRERYGVQPGDRVAILAANRPEWVIAFWATVASGGIVAALNGWWTEDEIRYGIGDCDPKVVIGDRARLARLRAGGAGAPIVEMELEFAQLEASAAGKPLPDVDIAEDDPAVILYTSGTTGRPKGAVNTHRGICGFVSVGMFNGVKMMIYAAESGRAPAGRAPASPAMLVTVPLFHLSGLYSGSVMMLAAGAKTVYRPGRFDPGDVLRLIGHTRTSRGTTSRASRTSAGEVGRRARRSSAACARSFRPAKARWGSATGSRSR
ncbi:MAG: acyl--CoA ligase [Deltaproteobacteria bacterium]|nr:MAG: acyl--CoA ligase [Deltaproteobacteria bacterium]